VGREIHSYQDLIAWQKAFKLGMQLYGLTNLFPERERFGLTIQLRRGGVSIASNIAEGYGRGSTSDYVRFLKVARGALYEIDTQLLFAVELQYVTNDQYEMTKADLDECERVLAGLIRSLDSR
jgi:four helix bundle protein